jgi:hypothetical protein
MRASILTASAFSLALLLGSGASDAADIDMRGFTCSNFEQLDKDNPQAAETMIVWLVGWYAGYGETYKFGDKAMGEAVKVLQKTCNKDGDAKLMKIMKTYLDDE